MAQKARIWIFAFIALVLFLPLTQKAFQYINSAPLNGEYKVAPDLDFSWQQWFDGSYWAGKDKYINDNMGLRPDLIRLNNQVDFSLFGKIHSEWRLVGNNSCIFQDVYIRSYLGEDFSGYPYIVEKVRKMKAIQDTLQKLGKSLIFVQSPCKAFFYPEYFPAEFKDSVKGISNFEAYKRVADSIGVNQVDLNTWFVSMKKSSTELLYPKQGFHWSEYGAYLGADSVIKYIEHLRGIHMLHPVCTGIEHTTKARFKDDDITKTMNLIYPFVRETFSYPQLKYEGDNTIIKPNLIYVGDSFLFQWLDNGIMDNTDSHWQIWYYNETLINKDIREEDKHLLGNYDEIGEIGKADCIIIMFTSRNLDNLGRNFIENTYNHYYPAR